MEQSELLLICGLENVESLGVKLRLLMLFLDFRLIARLSKRVLTTIYDV